jgi:valyl-tRNA synthetase
MPFVTESIWGYLGQQADRRGLEPQPVSPFVMTASWPTSVREHFDPTIERQFAEFQEVVGAIRRIRASQNIPPREEVPVSIACSESTRELLEPMSPYFQALAGAQLVAIGPQAQGFETDAPLALPRIEVEVHVDLEKFIDVEAELSRLEKLLTQLLKQINGKQAKLSNENFVSRAPADVVQKERDTLEDLRQQRESVESDIHRLKEKVSSN